MKVAVWDTYFRRPDGATLHFDVLVPPDTAFETVRAFGQAFLSAKGFPQADLDTSRCQFCHIEEATEEISKAIVQQGYFIVEMDDIPAELPPEPTRRDYILHLRAHYPEYRYADFREKSLEEVRQLVEELRGLSPR